MHWLPLALLCAFFLAAADTGTKRWLSGFTAAELVMARFVLSALILLPFLLGNFPPLPPAAFWGWVGAALPLEVLAMVLYVLAIRDSPLSLTLPYLAFTPVFSTLNGWLLLGETVSLRGLAGILLVVAGAYALQLEHVRLARPRTWLAPLAAIGRQRGSRYMLGVAFIYGVTSVFGKGALTYMPASALGPFYFVLLGAFSLLVFALREPKALRVLVRPDWRQWLVAALMAAMAVTHFLALERVATAYMISVKRVSILFGILFGALLFGEDRLAQHLLAAAAMLAGVMLIAL